MGSDVRWCVAIALYVICAGAPAQGGKLPVACGAAACTGGPAVWVTSGQATSTVSGTHLDVHQTSDKVMLNWAEFNVGTGNSVSFQQPGANSLAINKIFQNSPSQIFGNLTANGQIYLINKNGIVFGQGSQVNVRGLVASSLDIADEAAQNGILSPNLLPQGRPAFEGDGRVYVLDESGQVVTDAAGHPVPVKVTVEQGATLKAEKGGRIALFGQKVENAGTIESPDGQALLAAGQKVYLQASNDPDLRGLLVEVDAGGEVWNHVTGNIASERGNVSLVGLAVNQEGRISATTSVRANGSIHLLARDTVSVVNNGPSDIDVNTSNAGSVTLGGSSVTQVLPDPDDAERAVDEQAQAPSTVEVMGRQITMSTGSSIVAPGGSVSLAALPNPGAPVGTTEPLPQDPDSSIRLEAGSGIDVSGSTAQVSVTRNLVPVELRANELKDSPAQRDGALRGKTVIVDARVGTPLADVSGAVSASLKRDVNERTSTGGTISLNSQGSVAVNQGAVLDVSGGAIDYTAGNIATSMLVRADGSLVDIGKADPNATYRGVFQPIFSSTSRKWGTTSSTLAPGVGHYDPGYVAGASAGTVAIAAHQLLLNGTLQGGAINGIYQRDAAGRAMGGRLVIGLPDGQGRVQDFRAPSVTFVNALVAGVDPVADQLWLATDYLTRGGFSATEIYSNGIVEIPADTPLQLAGGSTLFMQGRVVDIGGSIAAPGGDVRAIATTVNSAVSLGGEQRPGVVVADGVSIATDGVWVNDTPTLAGLNPTDPLWIDAGRVDLSVTAPGGELVLGDDVRISADAGAWLKGTGSLQTGGAGAIALQARGAFSAVETGADLGLHAAGFESGGSLTFAANQIKIWASNSGAQRSDPGESNPQPYALGPKFFTGGGFQSYNIVATGGRLGSAEAIAEPLTVTGGANIAPAVDLLSFDGGFRLQPTGSDPGAFTSVYLPLVMDRPAASLRLAVEPHAQVTTETAGNLLVAAGSRISLDAGGGLTLEGSRQIVLDGALRAPAGRINVHLKAPPSSLDTGFDPDIGIRITGQLSAAGTTLFQPSDIGLRQGEVLAGGAISLAADRGSISLQVGSVLDVAGTAAVLDLPGATGVTGDSALVARTVASRGGAISLLAPEGIELDGLLRGASGGAGAQRPEGGSLAVGVSRLRGWNPGTDPGQIASYPTTPRQIVIGAASAGDAADGTVRFDPALVAAGGFDNLTLQADDAIAFGADGALAVSNRLELQAPNIQALPGVSTIGLTGNAIALGSRIALPEGQLTQPATGGSATLTVNAGLVDLFGNVSLQGIGNAAVHAASDLRLSGVPRLTPGPLVGSFSAAGNVTFDAAQVYPTTYTDFTVSVAPTSGELRIVGRESTPAMPLAAAGRLTLRADDIYQGGIVRAPLGQLSLEAADSLVLAPGSITSVAADGATIPFGKVIAGRDWYYDSTGGAPLLVDAPPGKRVSLSGADMQLKDGAVVDVQGGGDLYAYEFIPGPGGSADALSPAVNPDLFALMPGSNLPFAPFDTQEYVGSGLRSGDSIQIAGIPGLVEAGVYALLPARYALLPGALLIEAVPGTTDIVAGQPVTLLDGSPVTAGYRTIAGTTLRDSRSQGFAIRPGSHARDLAEYHDSFANDFFSDAAARADAVVPRLPRDAGDLRLAVGQLLELSGDLHAGAAERGRGARVDVSANNLEIVNGQSVGQSPAGVVQVSGDALASLGAASLLLGGTREFGSEAVTLMPAATTVSLAAGVALAGPEILLLATDEISIGAGARLAADGAATGVAADPLRIGGGPGSALVRVSRDAQVSVMRDAAAGTGDILIGQGAVLAASGSIGVDAAGTARSFGSFDISGGSLSLRSSQIALGVGQVSDTDPALQLSATTLDALNDLAELRIAATDRLQFAGAITFADAASRPGVLVLDAPTLAGTGADARLQADRIVLTNSVGTAAPATPVQGTGLLQLAADEIRFDSGSVSLDGFATAAFDAAHSAGATGEFTLQSVADLSITTPLISGTAGSTLELRAPGRSVTFAGGTAASASAGQLGAALAVEAGHISADTRLLFPSGRVRLAAEQNLELGAHSRIDASGGLRPVGPASVVTNGGDVLLIARNGDVRQAAGGELSVAAGSTSGRAGSLGIFAGGTLALDGVLAGDGPASGRSGSTQVYAGELDDFGALNDALNAGGFARLREIETGTGDIVIGPGMTVRADDVTLAASGGSLAVNGTIDAAAAGGGRIVLAARDDLIVAAGGVLDASNSGSEGDGGRVSLLATQGQLRAAAGSTIRAAGAGGAATGTVHLRAAATADDINVAEFAASLDGVGEGIFEPVITAAVDPTITAATIGGFATQLSDYMTTAAPVIRSRLGLVDGRDVIRPGLELTGAGDVALAAEWNLATWRYDGEPGYLTLKTPGQLTLNADLTDGFARGGTVFAPTLTQTAGPGWSYQLTGGAAAASALPWATAGRLIDGGADGGITLADNHLLRTGTGSIALAADGDLNLAGRGSLIYTAGVAARPQSGIGPGNIYKRNWVRDGGDITLAAGRDITAAVPGQLMSGWNVRSQTAGVAEWSIDFNRFQQGVAAMAGGNVTVSAGRDIGNLAASVLTTSGESPDQAGVNETWGGGNIVVTAGRDIMGGVFSTWRGSGSIAAGRSVTAGTPSAGVDIHPILSFGDGSFDVSARKDLQLEGMINPTTVVPVNGANVYFYTYAPTDALSLTAAGGNVTLVNDPGAFAQIAGQSVAGQTNTFGIYPATVRAAAPAGDINLVALMDMLPSPAGQFEFLAAGSIAAASGGVAVTMSDATPAGVPVAAHATSKDLVRTTVQRSALDGIHIGDAVPARLIAASGDIRGGTYSLAKHFEAVAGRDIRSTAINGQNTDSGQVSIVRAGRDVALPDAENGIQLGGPGRLTVLAGRNVDLGFSHGITTTGRTVTAALPGPSGAAVDVWAGLAGNPDFAAFNVRYWNEQYEAELAEFSAELVPYVESVTGATGLNQDTVWAAWTQLNEEQQTAFVSQLEPEQQVAFPSFVGLVDSAVAYGKLVTGRDDVTASNANDIYLGFDAEAQRSMVDEFLFRELRDSGREANGGTDPDFRIGLDAVATLFPESGAWSGDLSLVFSRIYTLDGGDIDLMAPGGLLNVGLATVPAGLFVTKRPSDLGIVAQGAGDVRIFTDGDVLVNQSRVFTLEGGDIMIWSSNGNIDAGRGSKSAISAPPPTITVSPTGEISVAFSDAIAGSGIRGILVQEGIEPGDVDLVAPTGEVNAGDAGIGSAGNLNIAAPQVVGLDNIQVGGVSTGVPTEAGGLAASLTGASSIGSSATDSAEAAAADTTAAQQSSIAEAALGWLEVFVEGFGDEDDEKRKRGQ